MLRKNCGFDMYNHKQTLKPKSKNNPVEITVFYKLYHS